MRETASPGGTAASPRRAENQAQAADEQQRAQRVGTLMMADDRASRHLGIELEEIGPGRARMALTVRPELTNGHGICHGGYIFLLADTAFAFACNSRNQRTVAAGCSIEFLAPAHEGDRLTAEATEQHLAGRHGLYDISVRNDTGTLIALFRGKSAAIRGHFFEETP